MRAEDFYSIRAEDARSSGFGALRGVTGVGAPLILGYQKSVVAHTGYPTISGLADDVEGKFKAVTGFAMPDRLAFGFRVGQRYLAQWLALAANDFWYPSMRRPPKTAAVRVNPPTFFKVFNFHR